LFSSPTWPKVDMSNAVTYLLIFTYIEQYMVLVWH
jgi:hypothetical protein